MIFAISLIAAGVCKAEQGDYRNEAVSIVEVILAMIMPVMLGHSTHIERRGVDPIEVGDIKGLASLDRRGLVTEISFDPNASGYVLCDAAVAGRIFEHLIDEG